MKNFIMACKSTIPVATAGMLLLAISANAQTADAIIAKTTNIMRTAKTYRATVLVSQTASNGSSMMVLLNGIRSGKKFMMKSLPVGKASSDMEKAKAMADMEMLDDGVNVFTFVRSMTTYSKGPSAGNGVAPFDFTRSLAEKSLGKWTLVGSRPVGGKDCFILEVTAKPNKDIVKGTTQVFIDKSNYHVRQMTNKLKINTPKGPIDAVTMVLVRKEEFNLPIQDKLFVFAAPPGVSLQGAGAPAAGKAK